MSVARLVDVGVLSECVHEKEGARIELLIPSRRLDEAEWNALFEEKKGFWDSKNKWYVSLLGYTEKVSLPGLLYTGILKLKKNRKDGALELSDAYRSIQSFHPRRLNKARIGAAERMAAIRWRKVVSDRQDEIALHESMNRQRKEQEAEEEASRIYAEIQALLHRREEAGSASLASLEAKRNEKAYALELKRLSDNPPIAPDGAPDWPDPYDARFDR